MEENTQPCDICGGLNFELVLGYYHCSECQTRKQGIQEHEIDEFDQKLQGIVSTKTTIKRQTQEQLEKVKLTTWECYNYVIKGLIEELLALGADILLRSVVKKLWFKYLFLLEVINTEKPKLQAVNTKIDAEIIYGKTKRKRKKRSCKSNNADLSSVSSIRSQREYVKKKKRLFHSHHDHSLSKSVDNSQMDETVESLKSHSQKSSESSAPLKYNRYARKELRRRQSKSHLEKHSLDFENKLACHRSSYREVSKKYQKSSHLLSINKIYSLLYLGLLLTKSKIQLGDMLRFIREGHLSFNSFKHFFPEEMTDNFLTQVFPKKTCLSSASLRESTFQIAKFLNVLDFIEVQNLALLIERYCTELNLPHAIKQRTLSSLVVTLPKMKINEKMKRIPNYEGRALSLILFQMKLLFSLDGKTERYLSDLAVILNNAELRLDMFDFMKWLQYIDYRKHVLNKHHFPTSFASSKQIKNSDSFIRFLISKNPEYEKEELDRKKNATSQDCRQLLVKLKDRQSRIEEENYLQASFTPSIDYIGFFLDNQYINIVERKILTMNFQECSFDFILNPHEYIHLMTKGKRVEIKFRGANTNIKQCKLINLETERSRKLKEDRKLCVVQLGSTSKDTPNKRKKFFNFPDTSKSYMNKFEEYHEFSSRVEQAKTQLNCSNPSDTKLGKKSFVHFVPYESYWVNTHCNLGVLTREAFDDHLSTYPYNFQFVLKEMAKIGEQNMQELLEEFSFTEIYLLYEESFQTIGNDNIDIISKDCLMKKIVAKAIRHW